MEKALKEIKKHFDEIESIFNTLTEQEQERIYLIHNETGTLQHCIRWGTQATEDILRLIKMEKCKKHGVEMTATFWVEKICPRCDTESNEATLHED